MLHFCLPVPDRGPDHRSPNRGPNHLGPYCEPNRSPDRSHISPDCVREARRRSPGARRILWRALVLQ